MKTYLRIVRQSSGMFEAIEYVSPMFKHYEIEVSVDSIQWVSEKISAETLITVLLERGWHQTDIGDALHDARSH